METVLLACTFAAFVLSVTGAPTQELEEAQLRQYPEDYQYLRQARSQYAPQYITPCAAAAAAAAAAGSIHMPTYAAPYHLNMPSYAAPHYGHGGLHYRSVDEQMAEPEMLAFSDMDQFQHGQAMMMDHVPMSRASYGAPISSAGSGLALNGPALTSAGGPAYGIFPNANIGGCNVPLLFSCSPSISSGRMMDAQPQIPPTTPIASGNSYRLVEQQPHHYLHESSEELQEHHLEQHLEPVHQTSHAVQSH